MSPRRQIALAVLAVLALAAGAGRLVAADPDPDPDDGPHATVRVKLAGHDAKVVVERQRDGSMLFVLTAHDGRRILLTPEAFARQVHAEQLRVTWWNRFFNISSATGFAWVALGLLGQLLFTARMLVQWLASERERRSVVPPVFWWLSLVGASMLIVYFVWRRDVVGVVGQATGWAIYVRNLWLIHRVSARIAAAPLAAGDGGVAERA